MSVAFTKMLVVQGEVHPDYCLYALDSEGAVWACDTGEWCYIGRPPLEKAGAPLDVVVIGQGRGEDPVVYWLDAHGVPWWYDADFDGFVLCSSEGRVEANGGWAGWGQ